MFYLEHINIYLEMVQRCRLCPRKCYILVYMGHKKAPNARPIGVMTQAVATEMRMVMAEHKVSAAKLASQTNLAKSTLHKTLRAERAIDVEDVHNFCDFFDLNPAELIARAAQRVTRDHEHPTETQRLIPFPVAVSEIEAEPDIQEILANPEKYKLVALQETAESKRELAEYDRMGEDL